MAEVGELQNAALKRREKLQEMRAKRFKCGENSPRQNNNSNEKEDDEKEEKLPRPIFRSYQPIDDNLKENSLPKSQPGKVEEKIQDQLEAANVKTVVEDVDLINLAPRKPDWDLKRDVAKRFEKLERRTQRAIAQLIRDRLKGSSENLLDAVNASDALAQADEEVEEND